SGEIIGLFLKKEIPRGKTVEETVSLIKDQGGIVYVPHPFDLFFRPSAIKRKALNSILPKVDIIEILNSHTMIGKHPKKIWKWAVKNNLLVAAGSDAHKPEEIGNSYVNLPEFNDTSEFKISLAKAHIKGQITHPLIRGVTFINRIAKRLSK
ncbi:MAG: hypothetical protein NTV30_09465, partial [Chloroflexi bacterium]|nr:hypothetical protein [Chloroflexota bacterium]